MPFTEKIAEKAPEPLPRRLRHFIEAQPGVSRLCFQTVALSPALAMSSTYWDSAEWAQIVSNNVGKRV